MLIIQGLYTLYWLVTPVFTMILHCSVYLSFKGSTHRSVHLKVQGCIHRSVYLSFTGFSHRSVYLSFTGFSLSLRSVYISPALLITYSFSGTVFENQYALDFQYVFDYWQFIALFLRPGQVTDKLKISDTVGIQLAPQADSRQPLPVPSAPSVCYRVNTRVSVQ